MDAAPPEQSVDFTPCESDEFLQNICDLCIHDDKRIEAKAYCEVCLQYFCVSCQKSHQRANASKLHKILTGKDIPSKHTKSSVGPTCAVHPGKSVEFFCHEHKTQCCVTCKVLSHTTCKSLVVLEKLSSKTNLKEDTNLKLNGLRCIFNEFKRLGDACEVQMSDLGIERQRLITSVKDMRKTINQHLDNLEANIIKQIDEAVNASLSDLKKQKAEMNSAKTELYQQLKTYEEIFKTGDGSQISLMSATMESEIPTYVKSLDHIYEHFYMSAVVFKPNKLLKDFNRQISSFGELGTDRNKIPIRRPYKEREAVYLTTVTYWSGGKSNFYAENAVVMPDGGIFLFDRTGKRLKLFDANYTELSEMSVDSEPWGMAMLSPSNAIIALPFQQTFMSVSITPANKLVQSKTIKTKVPYYKIVRYEGNMVANADLFAVAMDDTSYYFDLVDRTGKLLHRIRKEERSSQLFAGISCICLSQDNNNLYITDTNKGCFGLALANGNFVFKYKDDAIKCYKGICTDPEGLVYVSGLESNNITTLSNKGQKLKELVKLSGLGPCALNYSRIFNKLYVFQDATSTIKLFSLI